MRIDAIEITKLRELTERTGGISEFQDKQIRMWAAVLFAPAEVEVSWSGEIGKAKLSMSCREPPKEVPGRQKKSIEKAAESLRELLGSSVTVEVRIGRRVVVIGPPISPTDERQKTDGTGLGGGQPPAAAGAGAAGASGLRGRPEGGPDSAGDGSQDVLPVPARVLVPGDPAARVLPGLHARGDRSRPRRRAVG